MGTVFADRLSTRKRKQLQKQMEKAAEDYPPAWPSDNG
jgi:peptide deformylase